MKASRTIFAALVLAAMTGQTMAATSLCVEDVSTGLIWSAGAWKQQAFTNSTYIIREMTGDHLMVGTCETELASQGKSMEPVEMYGTLVGHGCYAISEVGTEPVFATACTEYWTDETTIEVVSCDNAIFAKFGFRPTGEFYVYSTGSITAGKSDEIAPDAQRQAAFVSVGKCSVVAP